jgi:hypothetical protein
MGIKLAQRSKWRLATLDQSQKDAANALNIDSL